MAELIPRIYSGFRGVDFRGEEINLHRSPDALNVWKDYRETESIRTRPEIELNTSFADPVYGVFFYGDEMLVHSGSKLYKVANGETSELYTGLNEAVSNSFVYDDEWYFKDGLHYLKYDGETIGNVVGYIPTTTIARKPMGGGSKYEDVNMLSEYRKNSFLADGASFSFFLDVINIDTDYAPIVTVNDEVVEANTYTVDYAEGKIVFNNTPPDAPLTDGQDNVVIQFKKAVPKYQDAIMNCTMLQVFDNLI